MNALTQANVQGDALSRLYAGSEKLWLKSQRFDLYFIIFSASIAVVPILLYYMGIYWLGLSSSVGGTSFNAEDLVTVFVMFLIGGPHVFTTYTRTYFERGFIKRKPFWFYSSFAVLFFVPFMALFNATTNRLLMTMFFFAASIHILHQLSYVVKSYNEKDQRPAPRWHRMVEYAVVLTSLYPVAGYRMVEGTFQIGRVDPMLPAFMTGGPERVTFGAMLDQPALFSQWALGNWFWLGPAVILSIAFTLFMYKSWVEVKAGTLHKPKFTLILITVVLGLVIPSFPNLDSSFQGYNAWHSFQYLALAWYINRLRFERGEISSSWVKSFSGLGRRQAMKFYATALGATMGLIAAVLGFFTLASYMGFQAVSLTAAYNAIAMAFLLVHYYHDAYFFSTSTVHKTA